MPELNLIVNNRSYKIACGAGEEARLTEIAADLDKRVVGLVKQFGQVGENHLLLVAALMLTDELDEAKTRRAPALVTDPITAEDANTVEQLANVAEKLAGDLSSA